ARLRAALDAFYIRGPRHNVDFLAAVLAKKRFADGRLSTDFIAQEFPRGFADSTPDAKLIQRIAAIGALAQFIVAERDGTAANDWVVCHGAEQIPVTVTHEGDGFRVGNDLIRTDWRPGEPLLRAAGKNGDAIFQIDRDGTGLTVTHGGAALALKALLPRVAALLARMPGLLVSLAVAEGQQIHAGDELAVVEAMKMMNVLRAERDARVKTLRAKPG